MTQDEGAHLDAAEWWFYTGHLLAGDGARYGFELVFSKGYLPDGLKLGPIPLRWLVNPIHMAHLTFADERKDRLISDIRMNIPMTWTAGADKERYRVWNGGWRAEGHGEEHHLHALLREYVIDLRLVPSVPPVLHRQQEPGEMDGGHTQRSYSYTKMQVDGVLTVGGVAQAVAGQAWMNHRWGGPDQVSYPGWERFSLQLNDGRELALTHFRARDGTMQMESSGVLVDALGHADHLTSADFQVGALEEWVSRQSGATFRVKWNVTIPSRSLQLQVYPVDCDWEQYTRRMFYWEGPLIAEGRAGELPVEGRGFVEMTGYVRS